MALGDPVLANLDTVNKIVRPAQIPSPWQIVIRVGGMIVQDAAAITNPTTEITSATRSLFKVRKTGTIVRARMGYDDGDTPNADPVIVAFGRYDATDPWQRLSNKAGVSAVTITTAVATDITDATDFFTVVDPTVHAWDLDGCDEVLFGVQTIYGVSAGSAALAFLQAKII